MLNLIIPVILGKLVCGESDYSGKAGDSVESGCSVDPFDPVEYSIPVIIVLAMFLVNLIILENPINMVNLVILTICSIW